MRTWLKFSLFCGLGWLVPSPGSAQVEPLAALLQGPGALDELDNIQPLPVAAEAPFRLVLGDASGVIHVYEERGDAFAEVWLSRYLEGAVSGLVVADVNDDELEEIVVFTDRGRIHYFDTERYNILWSNPPGEYEQLTAQLVVDIDDDPQPELVFCANSRLVIYDGRDRFEEWRSDQDNLTTTDILVADVDGDGDDELVLNDGYVFDARSHTLEWQSPDSFGERLAALDLDDDGILELIGEFRGRFLRIFDIDLRREKSLKPNY
jgi:hypothetical protein